MILEVVQLQIQPGRESDFEAALRRAAFHVLNSPGARSLRLRRCVESKGKYIVLIEWDRIEDHLVGFRQSEAFLRWREILTPYFAQPPHVEHFEEVSLS